MKLPSFIARHKIATVVTVVIVLVIGIPVALLLRPQQAQYVTAAAEKGDIIQTVEAVGTVTSEHDLELKFPLGGIVSVVNVKEGDQVAAGQTLAQLRSGNAGAAVAMQAANLQSAQADLQKLQEGISPTDRAVAQAALDSATQNYQQAKQQLDALKQEANTSLSGQVETARSTLNSQLVAAETALSSVDDVLSKTIVQDAIVKSHPGADSDIRQQRQSTLTSIQDARSSALSATDYQSALKILASTQSALNQTASILDQVFNLLNTLPETAYFSTTNRETYKTTISTQRGLVQTAVGTLTSALSALQSAAATYETRIASAEAAVTTNQGLVQNAQATLNSKIAPPRDTDLASAEARVRQAAAALAQAQASYSDTILRSPVDGTVTHVNVKVGEASPATGPAITVLGNSPFRVEMFVSEVDVPRLQRTQSGTIELDAFPGVLYKTSVSEIDTSPTLVDNVSKYRVKLDFRYPHEELKIGMTGDVTITTGMRQGVIKVPLRAVLSKNTGEKYVRVLKDQKVTEVPVSTGMEGQAGDVEVTSGLKGGETVVVLTK
jgi:RND family efflux transporter MFP subunit